jgi:hypothetical protein
VLDDAAATTRLRDAIDDALARFTVVRRPRCPTSKCGRVRSASRR